MQLILDPPEACLSVFVRVGWCPVGGWGSHTSMVHLRGAARPGVLIISPVKQQQNKSGMENINILLIILCLLINELR